MLPESLMVTNTSLWERVESAHKEQSFFRKQIDLSQITIPIFKLVEDFQGSPLENQVYYLVVQVLDKQPIDMGRRRDMGVYNQDNVGHALLFQIYCTADSVADKRPAAVRLYELGISSVEGNYSCAHDRMGQKDGPTSMSMDEIRDQRAIMNPEELRAFVELYKTELRNFTETGSRVSNLAERATKKRARTRQAALQDLDDFAEFFGNPENCFGDYIWRLGHYRHGFTNRGVSESQVGYEKIRKEATAR